MDVRIVPFWSRHLPDVVRVHCQAFSPEYNFSMRLGERFVSTTYAFFLEDRLSYGHVAKVDGRVAGAIVGRLDYYVQALNRYRFFEGVRSLALQPLVLREIDMLDKVRSYARRLVAKPKPGLVGESHCPGRTATIASICVLPEHAGPVADKLLSATEETCRNEDMVNLRACVARNNLSARFMYKRRSYLEDKVLSDGETVVYYLPLQASDSHCERVGLFGR